MQKATAKIWFEHISILRQWEMPALLKMQNMEGKNMGCAALIHEYAGGSVRWAALLLREDFFS